MKNIIILFISFLIAVPLHPQNLVPNGDFEQYSNCPTVNSQLDSCLYWISPAILLAGADYYNRCSTSDIISVPINACGIQNAKSGNGYSGIITYYNSGITNYREYIEIQLKSILEANRCYHISMYVNLANTRQLASADIGAYFSDTLITGINNYYPLAVVPQFNNLSSDLPDTLNWTLIEGDFIANGGELFMIIGNFKNDMQTNVTMVNPSADVEQVYLYIDDVSINKCGSAVNNANAGIDKTICKGDNVELRMQYYADYKYKWFSMNGTLLAATNSITVSPDTTTNYVLWISDFKYDQSYDTITVFVTEECDNVVYIPNIFSPNNDGSNDVFYVRGKEIESLHFLIYNRWGNLVFESNDLNQGWDGTQNGKKCEAGVYVYRVEVTFKNGENITKRGDVTLVR